MSNESRYTLTVLAKDKPGIVKSISDLVLANHGDWLESGLSRLGGQFAGIVSVSLPDDSLDSFKKGLSALVADGITIKLQSFEQENAFEGKPALVFLEANDRPGIIEEIASVFAENNINVEKLDSFCESASMAGYELFKAEIKVSLPKGIGIKKLESILETVSDDLMVSIDS